MRITHIQIGVNGSPAYRSIQLPEPLELAEGDTVWIQPIDEDDAEAQMLEGTESLKELREFQNGE